MSSSCRRAVAAAVALAAAPTFGANWEFEPRIEILALHDDNYRLTDVQGSEIEATGGFLDAEFAFRTRTPVSMLEILPRARTSVFPGEEEEESTDGFFGIGWERRNERLETWLDARYADESVVTSELLVADFPDIDLGDIVVGDSGRVSVRNRRRLVSVSPSLAYRWTQRYRFEAGLSYLDASFDETLIEQQDFTDLLANAGIVADVSQRDTFTARARVGVYDPDFAFSDTERAGAELEWARLVSPTTRFYARLGMDFTDTEVRQLDPLRVPVIVSVSESAAVGGLGASWRYQVTEILLDFVRSMAPSSAGVVMERDELRLGMRRQLRARLAVFGNLRGVRTQGAVENLAQVRDRDYLTGRMGVEWRMSRTVRLMSAYDYAWQEFEGEPSDATSNAFSISMIYEPRRRD